MWDPMGGGGDYGKEVGMLRYEFVVVHGQSGAAGVARGLRTEDVHWLYLFYAVQTELGCSCAADVAQLWLLTCYPFPSRIPMEEAGGRARAFLFSLFARFGACLWPSQRVCSDRDVVFPSFFGKLYLCVRCRPYASTLVRSRQWKTLHGGLLPFAFVVAVYVLTYQRLISGEIVRVYYHANSSGIKG